MYAYVEENKVVAQMLLNNITYEQSLVKANNRKKYSFEIVAKACFLQAFYLHKHK